MALAADSSGQKADQAAPVNGQVAAARQAVAAIEKTAGEVQATFAEAQEAGDTIRANCLGERLSQLKGLVEAGKTASSALETAVGKHDDDSVTRENAKLAALRKKANEVKAGAAECVGQSEAGDGKTSVDVLAQPEYDDSPIQPQSIPFARPAAASPTK